jgi:hypothetical protein
MRKIALEVLLYIFLLLFDLIFTQPALAHGGEPRLEIGSERLNPGSVLELRGVEFEYEEEVTLSLIGSDFEVTLGTAIADVEGIFLFTITLPADLIEGTYLIRATTDDHMLDSPEFVVSGVAAQNQEDNAVRDQSDLQLGAVPTFVPDVSSTPLPVAAPVEPVPAETSTMPVVWVAIGIGILLLFGLVLLRIKR